MWQEAQSNARSRRRPVGEEEELDLEIGADAVRGDEVRDPLPGELFDAATKRSCIAVWKALRLSCTSGARSSSMSVFSTSV
jgi:hypothetical protein